MSDYSEPFDESLVGLRYRHQLLSEPRAPLVVLVHGRAGTRDVMWLFQRCVPTSCHIVSFEAPDSDPIGGFSWWHVTDAPAEPKVVVTAWERFDVALDRYLVHHGLDPKICVGLGFSQGGGLLSVGMFANPEQFSGIGILAGFVARHAIQSLDTPPISASTRRSKIFWAHGTADQVVGIERARRDHQFLSDHGFFGPFIQDPVGHKVGTQAMRGLREWIAKVVADEASEPDTR